MGNYSRQDDPSMVECENCGWRGTVAECFRTYKEKEIGVIEPVDECPKCNSPDLIPLNEQPALL